ncbi:MAG: hypothetical protein ACXVBE_00235, partial [Bdellovibrionota bacterium]
MAHFLDVSGEVAVANSKFETSPNAGQDRGNCQQWRELRIIPNFPFGVTKDPNIVTYYAVRLQANARLLFSPFGTDGTVSLSAYSAAKPFGSRIGKDLEQQPSRYMVAQGNLEQTDLRTLAFPNPLVATDDTDAATKGFTRSSHLGYLRAAVEFTGYQDLGVRLAGAYAPWEVGYYTVPANFQAPQSIGLFEDNPVYAGKYFAMNAPLMPYNNAASGPSFLRDIVTGYLSGDIRQSGTLDDGPFGCFMSGKNCPPGTPATFQGVLGDINWAELYGYLDSSQQMRVHLIPDPLLNDEPNLLAYARAVGSRFTVAATADTAQKRQLTSWNNQKTALDADLDVPANSELGLDIGRSGYSVRFVSFTNLQAGGRATNDPDLAGSMWSNPFTRLNAGDAAARIQDDLKK